MKLTVIYITVAICVTDHKCQIWSSPSCLCSRQHALRILCSLLQPVAAYTQLMLICGLPVQVGCSAHKACQGPLQCQPFACVIWLQAALNPGTLTLDVELVSMCRQGLTGCQMLRTAWYDWQLSNRHGMEQKYLYCSAACLLVSCYAGCTAGNCNATADECRLPVQPS